MNSLKNKRPFASVNLRNQAQISDGDLITNTIFSTRFFNDFFDRANAFFQIKLQPFVLLLFADLLSQTFKNIGILIGLDSRVDHFSYGSRFCSFNLNQSSITIITNKCKNSRCMSFIRFQNLNDNYRIARQKIYALRASFVDVFDYWYLELTRKRKKF